MGTDLFFFRSENKSVPVFANEFDTEISFFSLPLTEQSFNESCACLYDEQKLSGQDIITVSEKDAIEQLNYKQFGTKTIKDN